MGLIAREVERRGIATVCLSSALSITRAVNPPRAVFLDYPLGHTAGRAHDRPGQRRILIDTLTALDAIQKPGTIRTLPYRWAETDRWKDTVMRPDPSGTHNDSRTERAGEPQYERDGDAAAAEAAGCPGCHFPEEAHARQTAPPGHPPVS